MKSKVSKVPLLKIFEFSNINEASESIARELEITLKRVNLFFDNLLILSHYVLKILDMEPSINEENKPLCQIEAFDPMTDFEQHDLNKHFSNSSCEIRFELVNIITS